jgi:hypothetical protein
MTLSPKSTRCSMRIKDTGKNGYERVNAGYVWVTFRNEMM